MEGATVGSSVHVTSSAHGYRADLRAWRSPVPSAERVGQAKGCVQIIDKISVTKC